MIHQNDYCGYINVPHVRTNNLEEFICDHSIQKEFATIRGQIAYVCSSTRPELSHYAATFSQVTRKRRRHKHVSILQKAVLVAKEPAGIELPSLDISSIHVAGYADGSFASNSDLSSQLGFIVLLTDKHDNAAIVPYGSWKCRCVTRSVLGSEVDAFTQTLDFVLALAHDISDMLTRNMSILMFTDSKCLFDTITKLSTVSDKRLLINISGIRESYTASEITNVAHVSSKHNLANVFTKEQAERTMLRDLMATVKLEPPISQWIIPSSNLLFDIYSKYKENKRVIEKNKNKVVLYN